jgi:hypothetical protein
MTMTIRALIGTCALCAVLCILLVHVDGKLDTERAKHEVTRQRLEACIAASHDWSNRLQDAAGKILGLQAQVRECLAREQKTQKDAAKRATIMKRAKPRARTDAEKRRIADDATRKTVADRLNRPL